MCVPTAPLRRNSAEVHNGNARTGHTVGAVGWQITVVCVCKKVAACVARPVGSIVGHRFCRHTASQERMFIPQTISHGYVT